mgnify:CR=1 FL=1
MEYSEIKKDNELDNTSSEIKTADESQDKYSTYESDVHMTEWSKLPVNQKRMLLAEAKMTNLRTFALAEKLENLERGSPKRLP